METSTISLRTTPRPCDCCNLPDDHYHEGFECADRQTVFTDREQKVHDKIRAAALRARELRKEVQRFTVDGPPNFEEKKQAQRELEKLRQLRAELEEERIAAANERMRLLGHYEEEPYSSRKIH